jgi:hypothetical protein
MVAKIAKDFHVFYETENTNMKCHVHLEHTANLYSYNCQ